MSYNRMVSFIAKNQHNFCLSMIFPPPPTGLWWRVSCVQRSRSSLPEPGTPINFIIGTVPNRRDQDAILTLTTPYQDVLSRLKIVNIYFSYKQSTCSIQNTQATKLFRIISNILF